jgi:hypothetical protein
MPLQPVGNRAAFHPNRHSSRQRLVIILSGVEHHLDDAFDILVDRCRRPYNSPRRRAREERI